MQKSALEGGFADPVVHSAIAFRSVMTAMARPGSIVDVLGALPPAPVSIAAGVVLLTLCDPETPVFLASGHDTKAVRDWITFHTGAPVSRPENARFGLGNWTELPLDDFAIGTSEYPDRSATLIVEMPELSADGATLKGPGIQGTTSLSLPELAAFQANAVLFPLGRDFIFTSGSQLAALPRTTRVR